jgi:hypothetical protein
LPKQLTLALASGALGLAMGSCADAQVADLFSRQTLSGALDLRLAGGSGDEKGWLDRSYGKTRYGKEATAAIANADLMWKPRLLWDLSGTVDVQYQPDLPDPVDLGEAYLTYKPVPRSNWRVQGRFGLMYPPISQEHDGADWHVTRTITPSAINAWVGDEVKVQGAEFKLTRRMGSSEIAATAAIFTHNDTSGTELSLRGWSLDDVRTPWDGQLPLPPLSNFLKTKQAPVTNPNWELDDREGYYGRLDYNTSKLRLNAFYYNNEGDLTGVRDKQWAWRTWFTNLGAQYQLTESTQILAQAMSGRTQMGFHTPRIWVDADYRAGYVLVSQNLGEKDAVTGRLDRFTVHDRTFTVNDNNDEDGWAATLAWKRTLNPHIALLVEAMQVESKRPSRSLEGLPAKQAQTSLQASLRLGF